MLIKVNNKDINVKVCKGYFSKFLGLMFSKKKNLLFLFDKEDYYIIHMFFVFFPIYVIWINKNKVVDVKKAYPLISILKPKSKSNYILETYEDYGIKRGSKVSL